MHFTLIVTSFNNDRQLSRLFDSLNSQVPSDFSIHVIYVNQNNSRTRLILKNKIACTEILTSRLSLSSARNIGLERAGPTDILAFPDDDCWYANSFFKSVSSYFSNSDISNLSLNVYDPLSKKYYGSRPDRKVKINSINIYFLPISVGIFVRFSEFSGLRFNEEFGVGSKYGCGEETLYLISGEAQKNGVYDGSLSVFHEVDEMVGLSKVKSYSYGFGAMIRESVAINYFGSLMALIVLLFRSLVAFFWFLLKRDKYKTHLYFYRTWYVFKGFWLK